MAYACDVLGKGNEDIMLAAGTDEGSDMVSFFYAHSKINGDNILGEGSSTVVLENASSADKRSAHKYAEVAGYACTHSAGKASYTEADAMKDALTKALTKAGIAASEIDSVYAIVSNQDKKNVEEAVLAEVFAGKEVIDVRKSTGDCRAASANDQIIEAASAIDAGTIQTAVAVSYGCGSYTAVVLKK